MSHHVYHTEGIILGSMNIGESNRFFHVLTRDLGLLGAFAQGIRELRSKLRYGLQTLSHTHIDLVRGKEVWRVTSASAVGSFPNIIQNSETTELFARLAALLRRLMPGESAHEEIFDDFMSMLRLMESETLDQKELRSLEALVVLRMLDRLGYWGKRKKFESFLRGNVWNRETLALFSHVRLEIQREINQALKESHL